MSHAPFSPSSAYRWLQCAASVSRSEHYPSTTSEAAAEGSRLHEVAAGCLLDGDECNQPSVQHYVKFVREARDASPGCDLLVEHKVTIAKDLCWGTLDAGILTQKSFTVIDFKNGTHPVQAVSNPQLMLYGLGLLRENPLPKSATVMLAIVQPRTTAGWPVKRFSPTVAHLLDFRGKVNSAIDAAGAPNPKAVTGEHCFYCPAKRNCPEYLYDLGEKRATA